MQFLCDACVPSIICKKRRANYFLFLNKNHERGFQNQFLNLLFRVSQPNFSNKNRTQSKGLLHLP